MLVVALVAYKLIIALGNVSCPVHLTTTIRLITLRTSVKETLQIHFKVAVRNFLMPASDTLKDALRVVGMLVCKMN